MTPTGPVAPATTRRSVRWATGWSESCTAAWPAGSPTRSRSPGRPPDQGSGGCRGVQPPGDAGHLLAQGRVVQVGRRCQRRNRRGERSWPVCRAPPKAAPEPTCFGGDGCAVTPRSAGRDPLGAAGTALAGPFGSTGHLRGVVAGPVTCVSGLFALVGDAVPFIGDIVALVGH